MNITKAVWRYLDENHTLRQALSKGVVSYSKLAREIIRQLKLKPKNFDAVLVACRRYKVKDAGSEQKIVSLLKRSALSVNTGITVAVVDRHSPPQAMLSLQKDIRKRRSGLHVVEGANGITIITSDDFAPLIKKTFKQYIVNLSSGHVELILKSPHELEHTPGFVGYLFSLFSERGINIIEEMSCWTDTIIVIQKDDLGKVLGLLGYSSTSSSSPSFFFSPSSSASS